MVAETQSGGRLAKKVLLQDIVVYPLKDFGFHCIARDTLFSVGTSGLCKENGYPHGAAENKNGNNSPSISASTDAC
jgi:hypothetical protein